MGPEPSAALAASLRKVKIFLCDVDGVLTDAIVFIGADVEIKGFNIQDGLGMACLRESGIKTGWVSSRISPATAKRAAELKIDFLHQAKEDKVAAIEGILRETGFSWDEVCYAGDDIVDLGALKRAGVAVAVANGAPETKALASYITHAEGGRGAVREVAELILKTQGKWAHIVERFSC